MIFRNQYLQYWSVETLYCICSDASWCMMCSDVSWCMIYLKILKTLFLYTWYPPFWKAKLANPQNKTLQNSSRDYFGVSLLSFFSGVCSGFGSAKLLKGAFQQAFLTWAEGALQALATWHTLERRGIRLGHVDGGSLTEGETNQPLSPRCHEEAMKNLVQQRKGWRKIWG